MSDTLTYTRPLLANGCEYPSQIPETYGYSRSTAGTGVRPHDGPLKTLVNICASIDVAFNHTYVSAGFDRAETNTSLSRKSHMHAPAARDQGGRSRIEPHPPGLVGPSRDSGIRSSLLEDADPLLNPVGRCASLRTPISDIRTSLDSSSEDESENDESEKDPAAKADRLEVESVAKLDLQGSSSRSQSVRPPSPGPPLVSKRARLGSPYFHHDVINSGEPTKSAHNPRPRPNFANVIPNPAPPVHVEDLQKAAEVPRPFLQLQPRTDVTMEMNNRIEFSPRNQHVDYDRASSSAPTSAEIRRSEPLLGAPKSQALLMSLGSGVNFHSSVTSFATRRASLLSRKPDAEDRFKCPHCDTTLTAKHNYDRHVNSHFGLKPFPCSCGRSYTSNSDRSRHRKGSKNPACHAGVTGF